MYFIFLTLTCGFLLLNVIVGVIIDEYSKQKELDMAAMAKDTRTEWLERKLLQAMHPVQLMNRPSGRCWRTRDKLYDIVDSKHFLRFHQSIIALNVIISMISPAEDDQLTVSIVLYLNVICVVFFVAEIIFKIIAYGMWQYIEPVGSKIDIFALLCQSIFVVGSFTGNYYHGFSGIIVVRVHHLFPLSSHLQLLLHTLKSSVPLMAHIIIMWILIYFTAAVIGMNMFSGIKHGEYLNDKANFDDFSMALVTLWRCSTGEGYNTILKDLQVQPPYCDDQVVNNCGSYGLPIFFFVVFYWIQAYVMMNLIVAVILDVYAETNQLQLVIESTRHHFDQNTVWSVDDQILLAASTATDEREPDADASSTDRNYARERQNQLTTGKSNRRKTKRQPTGNAMGEGNEKKREPTYRRQVTEKLQRQETENFDYVKHRERLLIGGTSKRQKTARRQATMKRQATIKGSV